MTCVSNSNRRFKLALQVYLDAVLEGRALVVVVVVELLAGGAVVVASLEVPHPLSSTTAKVTSESRTDFISIIALKLAKHFPQKPGIRRMNFKCTWNVHLLLCKKFLKNDR